MLATITTSLRITNAKNFIDSLALSNYYIGLGRVAPWTGTTETPSANDTFPPLPVDTINHRKSIWNNIFGLKKLSSNDARLAIYRYNWTSGTVYTQYSSYDPDLMSKPFYVMNTNFDIFKCISNNNDSPSLNMPTTSIPNTPDGYKWRFIYSVPVGDQQKFLMENYIPISNVAATPTNGEIVTINVGTIGSGYTTATVNIIGDGVGATATAILNSGSLDYIVVTNPGAGYTNATVTITGDGTGATAIPNLAPDGGHGYSPIEELFSIYVILAPKISYDESATFLTNNDFRQVSLIKDPFDYGTTSLSTFASVDMTTRVVLTNSATFVQDQTVEIRNSSLKIGEGVVAYNDTANNTLYLSNITSTAVLDTYTIFDGANDFGIISSGVTLPYIQPYSGTILYALNREPVNRNITQTETFKIVFEW